VNNKNIKGRLQERRSNLHSEGELTWGWGAQSPYYFVNALALCCVAPFSVHEG